MHKLIEKNGVKYYSSSYLDKLQNIFFDALKALDRLCKENNLEYFLDGGTVIGALRGHDIIPWDDDIDVSMLKKDYIRLVNIINENPNHYFLQDSELKNHCCGYFCNRSNYFLTYEKHRRGLSPIKIDIRPINVIPNTPESIYQNRVFRELANYLLFGKCTDEYKQVIIKVLNEDFNGSSQAFFSFYNKQYGMYDNLKEGLFVHPYLNFSNEKTYYYNDFFPLEEVVFRGENFFISKKKFLEDYYGDYLKLPDVESRKPESFGLYYTKKSQLFYEHFSKVNDSRRKNKFFEKIKWIFCVLFFLKKIR